VHQNYQNGVQFEDCQLSGPFHRWIHLHRVLPVEHHQVRVQDIIEFDCPLPPIGNWFGGAFTLYKLNRMFKYRHSILQQDISQQQKYLAQGAFTPMKILISGATGLVGSALVPFLQTSGHEIYFLSRNPKQSPNRVFWDVKTNKIDTEALERIQPDAVIHLAGEPIASGRWNRDKKSEIRNSRVDGTALLADTLARMTVKPKTFICASAIGIYGNRGEETLTETASYASDFLGQTCIAWERACDPARDAGIRVANLRFGIILSPKGGALKQMLPPFQLGAGGPLGCGKQYMSWIALDDVLGAINHALNTESLAGAINVVSPNPVTNREFSSVLGKVLFRPAFAPVPALAVKALFGEMGDALLLSSAKVSPLRLQETGYHFLYPQLEGALRHVLGH
jgi:hypothetical protein